LKLITNGNTRLNIQPDGKIGIGTLNTTATLEINSTTSPNVKINNPNTSTSSFARLQFQSGGNNSRYWDINANNAGSLLSSDVFNFYHPYLGNIFSLFANGDAVLSGNLVQLSDKRLKTNIRPLQNSLQRIQKLNGYSYNWIEKTKDTSTQIGFIAQEVLAQFPELVQEVNQENSATRLGVNYSSMIPILLEAIKEQQLQIETLQNKIINLEQKLK
jgi:hypothetical protein